MNTPRNKAGDGAAAAGWLHLAAAPTFAAMALVTTATGADPTHLLCGTMGHGPLSHGPLSLDGMTVMYLLMAIFHAAPWWKWILLRVRGHTRTKKVCAPETAAIESR